MSSSTNTEVSEASFLERVKAGSIVYKEALDLYDKVFFLKQDKDENIAMDIITLSLSVPHDRLFQCIYRHSLFSRLFEEYITKSEYPVEFLTRYESNLQEFTAILEAEIVKTTTQSALPNLDNTIEIQDVDAALKTIKITGCHEIITVTSDGCRKVVHNTVSQIGVPTNHS